MFLLELPAISTTLGSEGALPQGSELAEDVGAMMQAEGFGPSSSAVWVGHSFGSAALSFVIKNMPKAVAAAILVEPVCFLLNRPEVTSGFLYTDPDPILDVLRSDPGIAFSMRRRFWFQVR